VSARKCNHVIIIGGGASGVLLACHLLRDPDEDLDVTLIEKRPTVGRGAAYSTDEPNHVLNVRAANMSAFADDPQHFCRWLASNETGAHHSPPEPASFAQRRTYGRYIAGLVAPLVGSAGRPGGLRILHTEAQRLSVTSGGARVLTAEGAEILGDVAVLATGHDEVATDSPACYVNPWETPAKAGVSRSATILITGTGLTMVDYVLSLRNNGHTGPIYALSRRGLLPQPHRPAAPLAIESLDIPIGASLSVLWRWLRKLAQERVANDGDWRSVVDGIRPYAWRIWRGLSFKERRRFLRHARAWWEVHRHRMAPEVASEIAAAMRTGQLQVLSGKILSVSPTSSGAVATFRRRGAVETETLEVAKIVQCTGVYTDPLQTTNRLLKSLIADGLARPDPLGIGIDVDADCAVIGSSGRASSVLFAVGPLTRAAFWEIMAVPDIRVQCADIASRLKARLSARGARIY
jgi:uncharacterized NAD(P)/FAD-binding protein YdhS